jgi:hypothetical protein
MKSILKFTAAAFLVVLVIFISCKKDVTPKDNHLSPVADAGADMNINLVSCSPSNSIGLDGSHSSDPDNNITSYLWTKISGPATATISDPTSPIARLGSLSPGQYIVELKVTDAGGLSSKDTVLINITGPGQETDLDVTVNTNYTFYDNYEDCYYGPPCYYYDLITIQTVVDAPPIGQLNFYTAEYADTAISGATQSTNMSLYNASGNGSMVWGTCSVSLKQLIEQGGGPFSGTLTIDGGSAQQCNQNIYSNLAPLTVTGSLDTTTKSITIKITGKTYF